MIGSLRHRVTIARNDGALDAGGGQAADWTEVATVWARIDQLSASPGAAQDRAIDTASIEVTIRTRSDVSAGMRLTHRSKTYRIDSVSDPNLRGRWLTLSCHAERGAA